MYKSSQDYIKELLKKDAGVSILYINSCLKPFSLHFICWWFPLKGSSRQAVTLNAWCVPSHSCHVVLWACLPSCSKLPIDSVCHGLAQGPRRVAFVCSQPCPVSICCWDGLQCCHHPNQNKWTFVCCLLLNLTEHVPQKQGENGNEARQLHFAEDTPKQIKNWAVSETLSCNSIRKIKCSLAYSQPISDVYVTFPRTGFAPSYNARLPVG